MKIKWWPWGFLTLICLVLLGFFYKMFIFTHELATTNVTGKIGPIFDVCFHTVRTANLLIVLLLLLGDNVITYIPSAIIEQQ